MKLRLQNVGPIIDADLTFGDFTILVGPQASGKSIALQMLKLIVDTGYAQEVMNLHGLDWSGRLPEFFDAFFGEGMHGIWEKGKSLVSWEGRPIDMPKRLGRRMSGKKESVFLIPAQRVLTLRDGWPRPFSDYSPGDPFAVRDFSEKLRGLVEKVSGANEELFPQERRLKIEFREMLERAVFGRFPLRVEKLRAQKRLVLGDEGKSLPVMVWSAGQREFVPLLLGLYWLMPPRKVAKRKDIKLVVVEELEMGLHPRAIEVVVLMVLELLARGYQVCVSTHSPQVLDAVWTLRHLRENKASPTKLLDVFKAPHSQQLRRVAKEALNKDVRVYYFNGATGRTTDISDLEPDSEESGEAGWGGLTEFSGRANAAVADAVANV